jgi:hypothetical protein
MYWAATKTLDPHLHASAPDLQKFTPCTVIVVGACKLMLGLSEINSISHITKNSINDSLKPAMSWPTYNRTEVPEIISLSIFGVMHCNLELLRTVANTLLHSPKLHDMFVSKKCEPKTSTTVLPFMELADGNTVRTDGSICNLYLKCKWSPEIFEMVTMVALNLLISVGILQYTWLELDNNTCEEYDSESVNLQKTGVFICCKLTPTTVTHESEGRITKFGTSNFEDKQPWEISPKQIKTWKGARKNSRPFKDNSTVVLPSKLIAGVKHSKEASETNIAGTIVLDPNRTIIESLPESLLPYIVSPVPPLANTTVGEME